MTTIETPRLRLRPLRSEDAQPFLEIHQHPEVIQYLSLIGSPGDITVAWRNIALMVGHWQLRGYGPWAVTDRSNGDVIGRVGLWNPQGWPGLEMGWVIRRSRWGNGFATEAARAALDWAWANVDADHIISIIQPENTRSIRVAEKIGERFERQQPWMGATAHIYGIRRGDAMPR